MNVILKDIPPDDLALGISAARWLLARAHQKDAILAYGQDNQKHFYVKRNKASITVRPC